MARAFFVRGLRVDMQTLAEKLGVGRTTLYRWVGDRERLLGDVLGELTAETWLSVEAETKGAGLDRVIGVLRSFMVATSTFGPLRTFCRGEPQLALRILLAPDGAVPRQLHSGIGLLLSNHLAGFDVEANRDTIDTIVQVGTALQWAPIVIGEGPAIDRALRLIRSLLEP